LHSPTRRHLLLLSASPILTSPGEFAPTLSAEARPKAEGQLPPMRAEFRRIATFNQPDLRAAYLTFRKIQDAFRKRRPELLAEVSNFPLKFVDEGHHRLRDGKLRVLRNNRALSSVQEKIFDERVRRVVLNRNFDELFVNWRGFMFGDGVLWFTGKCLDGCRRQDFRVVIVNLSALPVEGNKEHEPAPDRPK
jgi:hypothetical protein